MINQFRIQNYKALRDVTIELTPIHVLIGPNDSGKTSILEAIAAICRSVDHPLSEAFTGSWEGHQLVWRGARDQAITLTASFRGPTSPFDYSLACVSAPNGRTLHVEAESIAVGDSAPTAIGHEGDNASRVFRVAFNGTPAPDEIGDLVTLVYDALAGVQSYHWDGRFLALPVAPDTKRQYRMEPSGFGLALCLDDILGYDRDLFTRLERRFKEIFPHIKSIKLISESAFKSPVDDPEQIPVLQKSDGKGLYFEFDGIADPIPARQVSDGVLLVLAYLTVLYLPKPPRVLLVEEPENGIHPKRLQDVLSILRDLVSEQSQTQVVLTTHSPYVVDLFQPDEVSLCKKENDGSVTVHKLSESKAVQDQLDVFTLGEIWTSEGDNALVEPVATNGER